MLPLNIGQRFLNAGSARYVSPQDPADATSRFRAAVARADSDVGNGAAAVKHRFQKTILDGTSAQKRNEDISGQTFCSKRLKVS